MRTVTIVAVAAPLVLGLLAACASSGPRPSAPPGVTAASITLTSKSFPTNGTIPVDYTCDGKDSSPQLTWSSPPQGTKAFVVVLEDLDAPSGGFTHWLLWNIQPDVLALPEALDAAKLGAKLGMNDLKSVRYAGPCPPHGEMHRYVFHVYATNEMLDLSEGANREAVDTALSGKVLGDGTLTATFGH